ncbi:hypothetical protein EYR40_001416 [Pleurotus pulmonarius]|nr:hypothetical protein EYR38_004657 [Pleurotus pulmonarius]KAF4609063.1 hypothetical protein EYR40_001416 [Pleurotus pulmonarius]
MYFNVKSIALLALTALTPMASALRYAGFSSTVGCSGSNFFCDDGGSVCCSLPTGFGFSVEFDNLPAGTQGQGLSSAPAPSRRSVLPARADNSTCAPSGFTYHDESGAEKTIKVPVGEAEAIAALHANKDFTALANFEAY